MKIAILLSGALYKPERSIHAVKTIRSWPLVQRADVFAHTWFNVKEIAQDSWSRSDRLEPSRELVDQYQGGAKGGVGEMVADDWSDARTQFQRVMATLEANAGYKHDPKVSNALGVLGMYWSLSRTLDTMMKFDFWKDYSLYLRLRYDCDFTATSFPLYPGQWTIPSGHDWLTGYNDQLAWFTTDWNANEAQRLAALQCYFKVFERIPDLVAKDKLMHPELLLRRSFFERNQSPARVPFDYIIK